MSENKCDCYCHGLDESTVIYCTCGCFDEKAENDDYFSIIKEFELLKKRIEKLENGNANKKPFECPACNGMCKFNVFGQNKTAPCPACEGKGIVWG